MPRGSLRIYLGASPGVGKTYKMLSEGVRRRSRGTDVVVGVVETHGRAETAAQICDLPIMPLKTVQYRDTVLREMDVEAILARRPEVVLVDEYAHTNAPGSKNTKRWHDVEQLLDAGIDVISTLNIQHLESLNDVITKITGTVQRETVPDAMVRRAEQLELVDMSPEAVRRRMAHGNIYPAERVDAALANYFRPGNLSALRELALLWVADRVEESLHTYLDAQGITTTWETRERVVVGLTGFAGGEALIRRAARMAGRVSGDLIGVHVAIDDGLAKTDDDALDVQRRLVTELGGTVHDVVGHDAAEALADFARREKATQLVLGASRRTRWQEVVRGSFVGRVTTLIGDIDVHIIAHREHPAEQNRRQQRRTGTVGHRGQLLGAALTVVGLPALVGTLLPFRDSIDLSTAILIVLVAVLGIATIGGRVVGAISAVVASLLLNWFFVLPYNTLTIAEGEHLITLVVFVAVAVVVGTLVDLVSRRSLEARRSRLEAEALARSTASLAADPDPVPRLVEHLRSTFELDGVDITDTSSDTGSDTGSEARTVIAASGRTDDEPGATIALAAGEAQPDDHQLRLRLFGRILTSDEQRLLKHLADQLGVAMENRRLSAEANEATALAEIDAIRTALLRAVSHDLRTPLASIKAMISGLRDPTVRWTPEQLAEAHATVEEETDRLNRLVGNLLDASRLQIGALAVDLRPTSVIDVVTAALQSIDASPADVLVDVPVTIPDVLCDPVLLERSVANVISNAIRFNPAGSSVTVQAAPIGAAVHIRVIDTGVGIKAAQRTKVVAPFQRLGDQLDGNGVGLGLAIAQGFVVAMDGTLELDDTPGGGLTVTFALPIADDPGVGHTSQGPQRSEPGSEPQSQPHEVLS